MSYMSSMASEVQVVIKAKKKEGVSLQDMGVLQCLSPLGVRSFGGTGLGNIASFAALGSIQNEAAGFLRSQSAPGMPKREISGLSIGAFKRQSSAFANLMSFAPSPSFGALSGAGSETGDELVGQQVVYEEEIPTIGDLKNTFGIGFLAAIVLGSWLLQGVNNSLVSTSLPYMLEQFHLGADSAQTYTAVTSLTQCCSSSIGIFTVFLTFRGWRKCPWLIIMSSLAVVGYFLIWRIPISALPLQMLVGFLIVGVLQSATVDAMIKGELSANAKQFAHLGQTLVSFYAVGIVVGGCLADVSYGPISGNSKSGCTNAMLLCAFLAFPAILVGVFNLIGEKQDRSVDVKDKLRKQWGLIVLAAFIFFTAMSLVLLILVISSDFHRLFVALVLVGILLFANHALLRPEIAKAITFFVINGALAPNISMASTYFFTDTAAEFPGGPNFTPDFYNSALGAVGLLSTICGQIVLFPMLTRLHFKDAFMISNFSLVFTGLPQIIQFARLNLAMGIDDHTFAIFLKAWVQFPVVLQHLPQFHLCAHLCPAELEVTLFSFMVCMINIGSALAQYTGSCFMSLCNVLPSGALHEQEEFKNMGMLAFAVSMCPLLSLPFIQFLLPDAGPKDQLLHHNHKSAVVGCWLYKWCGWDENPDAPWDDQTGSGASLLAATSHRPYRSLASAPQSLQDLEARVDVIQTILPPRGSALPPLHSSSKGSASSPRDSQSSDRASLRTMG